MKDEDAVQTPPTGREPPKLPEKDQSMSMTDRMRKEYAGMPKPPGLLSTAESLLRYPGRVLYELREGRATAATWMLLGVAIVCLLAYGCTMGMFSFGRQLWAAPVKLAVGMLGSALICAPSLVIFSCLSGSRTSIADVLRMLAGLLAMASLLLLGFGPVSWIFSQSTESVGFMGFLHLVFWSIGVFYGLRFVYGATRFSDGTRVGHLRVWSVIFVLVCLQMTTTLRPLIGESDRLLQTEKKFFLTHWGETMCGE
jgi:hypothetical protein